MILYVKANGAVDGSGVCSVMDDSSQAVMLKRRPWRVIADCRLQTADCADRADCAD